MVDLSAMHDSPPTSFFYVISQPERNDDDKAVFVSADQTLIVSRFSYSLRIHVLLELIIKPLYWTQLWERCTISSRLGVD